MEPFRIYGKTERGSAALTAERGALASSARQLLILVDGQRTLGDLRDIFGDDALAQMIPQLERQGYIQFLRDGEGSGPLTTFALPPAPAVEPVPARPPRNGMAIGLLALGVVGASAAIWWFLGPARTPGSVTVVDNRPAAPDGAAAAPEASATVAGPLAQPAAVPAADPVALPRAEARAPAPAPVAPTPRSDARIAPAPPTPRPSSVPASVVATPAAVVAREPAPPPPNPVSAENNPPAATAPAARSAAATPAPAPTAASVTATSGASAADASAAPGPATTRPQAIALAAPAAAAGSASATASGAARNGVALPQLHPRDRVMPVLSRRARRAGIDSGELVVRLHVTDRGTVAAVDVIKATPPQVYDAEIEQTLQKWTFDPPGIPVVTNVAFSFKP